MPPSESQTDAMLGNEAHLAETDDLLLTESTGLFLHQGAVRPLSPPSLDNPTLAAQEPDLIHSYATETPVSEEQSAPTRTNSSGIAAVAEGADFLSEASLPPLFPTPKRTQASKWLWIGLLASLGLHIGLVLVPTGNEPVPTPPKDQDKQVRITQLPKLVKTVNLPKKVVAKPTVKPVVRQRTAPPIAPPLTPPKPAETQSQTTSSADSSSSAWDDFPIYPGAEPGCFNLGSCLQTSDSLSQVADFYGKELPAKKYEFKPTLKEANRQVFQVSRNGQSQFLSIIQTDKGQAIVLSDAPRSLEDLKKAVEVPPEVAAILSNLDAQNADQANFAQPDLFYTRSTEKGAPAGALVTKPSIRNISLVSGYSYDTMMDEFFRSNLQLNDYEIVDSAQDFGGGKVYQITKGTQSLYLNLVPTKDQSGTLVVVWKDPPR